MTEHKLYDAVTLIAEPNMSDELRAWNEWAGIDYSKLLGEHGRIVEVRADSDTGFEILYRVHLDSGRFEFWASSNMIAKVLTCH